MPQGSGTNSRRIRRSDLSCPRQKLSSQLSAAIRGHRQFHHAALYCLVSLILAKQIVIGPLFMLIKWVSSRPDQ